MRALATAAVALVWLLQAPGAAAAPETIEVRDITPAGHIPAVANGELVRAGTQLYFRASAGSNAGQTGSEVYVSDGTFDGTSLTKDIFPGGNEGQAFPTELTPLGDDVYFGHAGSVSDWIEPWTSDGTEPGTHDVGNLNTDPNVGSLPTDFVSWQNRVYFAADGDGDGRELWRTSPSTGTLLQDDILTGSPGSNPTEMTPAGSFIYYAANGGTGRELWRSTSLVNSHALTKDINPSGNSNPEDLTAVGNKLFFTADDGSGDGRELWVSDGSAAGTFPLGHTNDSGDDEIAEITDVGGKAVFRARGKNNGIELWWSDGTVAGTEEFQDLAPGAAHGFPSEIVPVGDDGEFFFAATGPDGRELWFSKGVPGDAEPYADINPGAGHSNPTNLTEIDRQVYFSATDGVTGREPWRTHGDGDVEPIADIRTGASGSDPREFTEFGGGVYFLAAEAGDTHELWATGEIVPNTLITGGPAEGAHVATSTPQLQFAADEAGASFECRVDNGAWAACTSPHAFATTGQGSKTLRVRAVAGNGAKDPTPAERTVVVDTLNPDTSITAGPAQGATITVTTATFEATSNEAGATFRCSLDGEPFAPCGATSVLTGLAEGDHVFRVQARDAAGNDDPTPAEREFTVDLPPETQIDTGPVGPTNDNTPTFTFSANEPSTFECSLVVKGNPAAFGACSGAGTHTPAALADGDYTFAVRATDAADNTDPDPATQDFTVDTTPPPDPNPPGAGPTGGVAGAIGGSTLHPRGVVKGKQVLLTVTCTRAGVACTGVAKITKKLPRKLLSASAAARKKKKGSRNVILVQGGYSVAPGQTQTVKLALTGQGRKVLRKRKKLGATAILTSHHTGEPRAFGVKLKVKGKKKKGR